MSSGRRRAVLTLSGQTGLQGRSWPSLGVEPRRPSPLSVRWDQDLVSTEGQGLPLTRQLEDKASPDSRGPTAGPFQGLSNTWFTSESCSKPRGTHSEGTKAASMGRIREQPARPAHTQTRERGSHPAICAQLHHHAQLHWTSVLTLTWAVSFHK